MLAAGHVPRRPGRPPLIFETEEAKSEHARQKRLLYNWRRKQKKMAAMAQTQEVVADAAETGSTDT